MKLKNAERTTKTLKEIFERTSCFNMSNATSERSKNIWKLGNKSDIPGVETLREQLGREIADLPGHRLAIGCLSESRHCCSWMMLTLFPSEAFAGKQFADVSSPAVEPALSRPQRERRDSGSNGAKRSRRAFFRKPTSHYSKEL